MEFAVKLLRVPSLDKLSGWDVFALMSNARHVGGDFWIIEGEEWALQVPDIEVVAEGITEGYGNMNGGQVVAHCEEIFDIVLGSVAPAWKMLAGRRDAVKDED